MFKRHISTKFLLITASLLLVIALVLPLLVTVPSAAQTTEVPTHSSAFISSEYDADQTISWVNSDDFPVSFPPNDGDDDSFPIPFPPEDTDAPAESIVNWGS